MNDVSLTDNDRTAIAIGADAVAGTLDLCEVNLFIVDLAIDRDTDYTVLDTDKATYTGAGYEVVTWGPATRADDGTIEYLGTCGEFRPTDAVTPNAVFGFFVRNAAHNDWLYAARFDNPPLPMQSALDAIQITLRFRPDSQSLAAIIS